MAAPLLPASRPAMTRRTLLKSAAVAAGALAAPRWLPAAQLGPDSRVSFTGADSLRAHAQARGLFYGASVHPALLDLDGLANGNTADPYTELVVSQANILVAENAMKWEALRPTAATFNFAPADRLLRFATLAQQRVRGHNLCWHEALPAWFKATATTTNARNLLVEHIQTVAGRYKGQIHSWDVVNEAVEPKDGRPDGLRTSPWLGLVGPDYIELAFQTAAAADPGAKLVYNEYGIELDTAEDAAKRGHVMMLLRRLKARNIPIHAVGIQSHLQATGPQPGIGLQTLIRDVRKLGLDAYITELDVNTHNLEGGPEAQDYAVAQVYRNYLGLVLAEPNVPVVLTWGITAAHTFLNESSEPWIRRADGFRQHPLPFDDDYRPTPAFIALRNAIDYSRPLVATPAAPATPQIDPNSLYKPFRVQGSPTTAPPPASLPPTPQEQ
ncbi:endo-1,4-beta-xylanase [Acidobacteria bacterium AB60]|nr:endo-1,4-beta-xylanase [Acidobacteria bacterium AB60]